MKKILNIYCTVIISFVFLFACKQSPVEGYNPPSLKFKTSAGYTYNDTTINGGDPILIGIIAERGEIEALKDADDLSNLIVKMSANGAADVIVYEHTMTADEAALYEYEYSSFASAIAGDSVRFNVVVYNKDGYIAQKELTVLSN